MRVFDFITDHMVYNLPGLYLNLADDNHLTYIKGTINRMQKLHIQQIHDLGVVNV